MATKVHVALPDGYREALIAIAARLRRLSPDYQRPERFHMEKDDILDSVLRLAGERR